MAKRGSTGFHARPKLTSSAGLFEKRGDKWGGGARPQPLPHTPTPAEQAIDAVLEKMGNSHGYAAEVSQRLRQANTDDPDMDRWTRASFAEPRPSFANPKRREPEATPQRKAANVLARMHREMRPKIVKARERDAKPGLSPCSDEVKIGKLMDAGWSLEKARQLVAADSAEHQERMSNYAAKKFGRG